MAELTTNKVIALVLVVLVIAVVLIFIFKPDILSYIKNLPEYKYEYDEEVELPEDVKGKAICPKEKISGVLYFEKNQLFREHYIYLFKEDGKAVRTNFYWRGDSKEAKIYLLKKDAYFDRDWFKSDIEIAEVRDGKIKVKEEFFDLDNDIFHLPFKIVTKEQIAKLHNSFYYLSNLICKLDDKEIKFRKSWQESEGIIYMNLIDYIDKDKKEEEGYVIRNLPNFAIDRREANYFYFKLEDKYIHILGKRKIHLPQNFADFFTSWSDLDFGRIYPDGSLWVNKREVEYFGMKINSKVKMKYKSHSIVEWNYWETNVKVDYDKLKNLDKVIAQEKVDKLKTSNTLPLAFYFGKHIPIKLAHVSWDFVENSPRIYFNEYSKAVTPKDYSFLDDRRLLIDFKKDGINVFKKILTSKTPAEFSEKILNIVKSEKAYLEVGNKLKSKFDIKEINNLLYGVDFLPS